MTEYRNLQLNNSNAPTPSRRDLYVDICVYAVLLCNLMILLGNPYDIDFLVSWGTRIMVIFVTMLSVLAFVNIIRSNRADKMAVWFVVTVILTVICFVANCTPNLFNNLVSYMCFLMLPGCAIVYRNAWNPRRLKIAIHIANTVYFALFVWLSFSNLSHIYYGEYNIVNLDELTLGYRNPNETGMYLMLSFAIMFSGFEQAKKRLLKAGALILTVVLYVFIWQTGSRTCILLASLIVLARVLNLIWKAGKWTRRLILVMPILVALWQLLFPEMIAQMTFLDQGVDTGRREIYEEFLSSVTFWDSILGNFAKYPGLNMHSSIIALVAMFGVPATIVYMGYLESVMTHYFNRLRNPENFVAFAGFLAIILHGVAEAAMLVSGAVYAGLGGLLFILMLPDREEAQI